MRNLLKSLSAFMLKLDNKIVEINDRLEGSFELLIYIVVVLVFYFLYREFFDDVGNFIFFG